MTTYEKIVQLLQLHTLKWVGVKTRDHNGWKVFTYLRPDGYLEGTCMRLSIEDCWEEGLMDTFYSKEEFEEEFSSEIIPIPQKPNFLPIGTKVRILEIAKEINGYDEREKVPKEMIWWVYEVRACTGLCYYIWNKSKTNYWDFPYRCVVPVFDDEEVEEIVEKNGKKYKLVEIE